MRWCLPWLLAACAAPSPEPGEDPLTFGFPLPQRDRVIDPPFVGVDHDPEDHGDTVAGRVRCTAHNGEPYPYCYDQHDGTDLMLRGGFEAMDERDMPVVAAADGVVISIEEAQYDRCHLEGTGVSCDGFVKKGNHVILEHEGGVISKYWHLRTDSVPVEVGEIVACGTELGLVGSSGQSVAPHLHFELEEADGTTLDPFAGPESQPVSWWTEPLTDDGMPGPGCTE